MINLDLHIHSKYSSNGQLSVSEIIDVCQKTKVQVISITDFNNVQALDELSSLKTKITIIPGIEISTQFQGKIFEVLGYFIDHKHPGYQKITQNYQNIEAELLLDSYNIASKEGFEHSKNHLTKEYLARDIIENINNNDLKHYRFLGKKSNNPYFSFTQDYFENIISYLPHLPDILNLIHESGGIAILAHPGKRVNENLLLLEELFKLNLDGLEVYSGEHSHLQTSFYKKFALKNRLLMTSGSNYYGDLTPHISIGSVLTDLCKLRMYQDLVTHKNKILDK